MAATAAALGLPQLADIERRWTQRRLIWDLYADRLKNLPLTLPAAPEPDSRHAYHLYTPLLVREAITVPREKIIAALRAENILVGIHFVPVHQHPYYQRRYRFKASDFPNAALVGDSTISLPLTPDLSEEDVSDVCTALKRVLRYFAAKTKDRVRRPKTGRAVPKIRARGR